MHCPHLKLRLSHICVPDAGARLATQPLLHGLHQQDVICHLDLQHSAAAESVSSLPCQTRWLLTPPDKPQKAHTCSSRSLSPELPAMSFFFTDRISSKPAPSFTPNRSYACRLVMLVASASDSPADECTWPRLLDVPTRCREGCTTLCAALLGERVCRALHSPWGGLAHALLVLVVAGEPRWCAIVHRVSAPGAAAAGQPPGGSCPPLETVRAARLAVQGRPGVVGQGSRRGGRWRSDRAALSPGPGLGRNILGRKWSLKKWMPKRSAPELGGVGNSPSGMPGNVIARELIPFVGGDWGDTATVCLA